MNVTNFRAMPQSIRAFAKNALSNKLRRRLKKFLALGRVEAQVDTMTQWGATGWLWNPWAPQQIFEVEAVLHGRVIGRSVADEERPDVASSGRGVSRCGFSIEFDSPLQPGDVPTLRAIARRPVAHIGNALHVDAGSTGPGDHVGEIEGNVDTLTEFGTSGWVWKPADPNASLFIEVLDDDEVIGSARADRDRPELSSHGKGTGLYGFSLKFDRPPRGVPTVRAIDENQTSIALPLNPEILNASEPRPVALTGDAATCLSIEGFVESLEPWSASGWAWDPKNPQRSLAIEAVVDGIVVGRATADALRKDLEQAGKGTGHYGFTITLPADLLGGRRPQIRAIAANEDMTNCSVNLSQPHQPTSEAICKLFEDHSRFTAPGKYFEEFDPTILRQATNDEGRDPPTLIAFYLPQFHAIPENDRSWGRGFTEWRQLSRSIPRFPGHYQPRIPRDLGFYDLGMDATLRAQTNLAKAAGIGAFAFYYYWFNGKRVLEKPVDRFLASDIEMPFLIIWANENWTKTWDGLESNVLLRQDYKDEHEAALLADLARHFADPRYFRIDGRPLFIIYNPGAIPESKATIERWRKALRSHHNVDPLIFNAQTFTQFDPSISGLDGAIEFPPHKLSHNVRSQVVKDAYTPEFRGHVFTYDQFVNVSLRERPPNYQLIKTVVPSWDNDARRPNRGITLSKLSPAKYQMWLTELLRRAMKQPTYGRPIVAINAWNEWAEGAYLEPDVHFGAAYLNATARALVAASKDTATASSGLASTNCAPVTAILPNYNHSAYLPERLRSVLNQTMPPSEIIFLDDNSTDDSVKVATEILENSDIPFHIVRNEVNSGCPFKQWTKGIALAKNSLIWIAETDDTADDRFLETLLPAFDREDVLAALGNISYIDSNGRPCSDLDTYYNGLKDFSWSRSQTIAAHKAFSWDFAIKNVVPNASGVVFRKPVLTPEELERLHSYSFAGDWYFYALVLRGGALDYNRDAKSYFRVNRESTSRSKFSTEKHLHEHMMVVQDLSRTYGIPDEAVAAHSKALSVHFPDQSLDAIHRHMLSTMEQTEGERPLRICIAAHNFSPGGGEVLPVELANHLKGDGHHVTFMVLERLHGTENKSIRQRLRQDIPVIYWEDVRSDFSKFIADYGIEIFNSHNVSVEYHLGAKNCDVNVPYVASLHGGYETVPHLLTPKFIDFVDRNVDRWLYLADKNREPLVGRGVGAAKFARTFNALPMNDSWVDREEFRKSHGIPQDAFVMVLCSRALREKGWQIAIDVCRAVRERAERPVYLVLIGDGPAAAEIKAANADADFVVFLGFVDKPVRYFRCFDLGILPSRYVGETFPLFLLECFQAGLAVVATDIGEIPRMLGDVDQPGFIVNHKLGSAEIAGEMIEGILKIIDDPAAGEKLTRSALDASERFSIARLGASYLEIFRALTKP